MLEAFGAESSAKASAKTDARWTVSAAKPSTTEKRGNAETPFFASFPEVSSSLSSASWASSCWMMTARDRSRISARRCWRVPFSEPASATLDPKERRASLTAEARTLLDALDREKGAWEPVVEPWRLRLGADASFHADGAPSKIDVTFTGVDALEITVGRRAPPPPPPRARSARGPSLRRRRRFRARIGCTTPRTSPPSTSSTAWPRRERTTRAFAVSSRRERASPSSSREPKRAPRRDTRVGRAEPWTTPAPALKPARRRAVVVRFQDGLSESGSSRSPPTPPIELDAFGVFELAEMSTEHARVVAEVRRLADDDDNRDANDASLWVSGLAATRAELLLRSDLAFHNATLSPVELDLDVDGVDEHRVGTDPVRVEAGSRLWLPASLADERARARWRPAKLAGSDAGDGIGFGWSEPVSLRAVAERRVFPGPTPPSLPSRVWGGGSSSDPSLASSSDPSANDARRGGQTPIPWTATTTDADGTTTPFACVVSGRSDPRRLAAVVALAPQLYVTNALAVPVTVSASATSSAKPETDLARVIAPGDTAALHDAALDPRAPITVRARPRGFTHCESVAVPPSAPSAAPSVFEAFREVFAVRDDADTFPNVPVLSSAPVSVRVSVTVDDRGARRVAVSAPARALNATDSPLAILTEPDAPPDPESLALGLALDARRGPRFLSAGEAPARPVSSPQRGRLPGVSRERRGQKRRRGFAPRRLGRAFAGAREDAQWRDFARGLQPRGARAREPASGGRRAACVLVTGDGGVQAELGPRGVPAEAAGGRERRRSDVAAATDAAPADGFGGVGAAIEREGSRCRDVRALRRVASRVSGSGHPVSALVRVRTADSSWWSPSTRLVEGDAPRALKLPRAPFRGAAVKRRWTHCDEYVASLVRSDVVGAAAAPLQTVTVRPRFTVRSHVACRTTRCFSASPIGSDADRAARRRSRRVAVVGLETRGDVSVVARLGVSARASRDLVLVRARRDRPPGHARHGVGPSRGRRWRRGTEPFASFRGTASRCPRRAKRPGAFRWRFSRSARATRRLFFRRRVTRPRVLAKRRVERPNRKRRSPAVCASRTPRTLTFPGPKCRRGKQPCGSRLGSGPRAGHRVRRRPRERGGEESLGGAARGSARRGVGAVRGRERGGGRGRPRVSSRTRLRARTGLHAVQRHRRLPGDPARSGGIVRIKRGASRFADAGDDGAADGVLRRARRRARGPARASAAFFRTSARGRRGSVSGADASGASRANGGSWCARSFSVDAAPMTIGSEAFGSSAPRAAARLAAPAAGAAPPALSGSRGGRRPPPSAPHLGFQSVRIGRIDAVVSFAALPFLPAGVRSIGAVDRARVALRAFALTKTPRRAAPIGRASFSASRDGGRRKRAFVSFLPSRGCRGRLAARHYLAESASQIVRLVASNKLLGRPRASVGGARSRDARAGRVAALGAGDAPFAPRPKPPQRGPRPSCGTRREVTSEMEERFEAAKRRRVERLRSRRIADDEAEDDDESSRGIGASKEFPEADAERAAAVNAGGGAGVVAGGARAGGTWWRARCRAPKVGRARPGGGRSGGRVRRGGFDRERRASRSPPTWRTNWRGTDSAEEEEEGEDEDETKRVNERGFPARVAGDGRRRDFAHRPPRPAKCPAGGLTRASR